MKRSILSILMVLVVLVSLVSVAFADDYYVEAQVGVVISERVSARMSADTRTDAVAKLKNGTRMCIIGKTTGYYDGTEGQFYIVTGDSIGVGAGNYYVAADFVYLGCPEMVRMPKDTKIYAGPSRECKAVAEISANQERMVLEKLYVNGELWYSIQVDADNRGCGMVASTDVSEIYFSTSDQQLQSYYRGQTTFVATAQEPETFFEEEELDDEQPVIEQNQVAQETNQEAAVPPVGGGNVVAGQNAKFLANYSVVANGTTYSFNAGDVVYVWDVNSKDGSCKVVYNSKMIRVESAYLTACN